MATSIPPPSYEEATRPPAYEEAVSLSVPPDSRLSRSPSPTDGSENLTWRRQSTPRALRRNRSNSGLGLTFLDFVPEKISSGSLFGSPQFERFPILLERANQWLSTHTDVEACGCESVEFKCKSSHVETEKSTYFEHGEGKNYFIRALRLWLNPRGERLRAQHIRYFNLVPKCLDPGGLMSSPRFETLNDTIKTLNRILQQNPIEGRILNIETQEMKVHRTGPIDPDCSCWSENSEHKRFFVFIFRVFYEIGRPVYKSIDIKDFVPQCLQQSRLFFGPQSIVYESFSSILSTASNWWQEQCYHIINVQSVEMKLKGGQLDCQRMSFTEHSEGTTHYVRVLRLIYATDFYSETHPPLQRTVLSCKTFMPVQLSLRGLFGAPDFETISQTRTRLMHWMKHTGAKVISAETVDLKIFSENRSQSRLEATYVYNHGDKSEHWIHVLRVFLAGVYPDPPAEVLPPVPTISKPEDCLIS